MRIESARVVLTGAGSGIGRALAGALAARGARLALIDRDAGTLEETARGLGGAGHLARVLDVADARAAEAAAREVARTLGGAECLVNNAGVGVSGPFEDIPPEDFEHCWEVNLMGTVRMTRAFLPLLHRAATEGAARPDPARVVNVSSLFGLIAPAGQSAYAASKFAVAGFSGALRADLHGTGVGVSVVHPGGVATNIARAARVPMGMPPEERERRLRVAEKLLTMPPARAAAIVLRGIAAGRARIVVGRDAWAGDLLARLLPVRHADVIRCLGIET